MNKRMALQSLLMFLSYMFCVGVLLSAEPAPVGIRGLYEDAYTELKSAKDIVEINHPAIARLWGTEFLDQFAISPDTGKPLPKSGKYTDARKLKFLLTPFPLAAQMGYKEEGGAQIREVRHNGKQVELDVVLYVNEGIVAPVTVITETTEKDFKIIHNLFEALRLRVVLEGKLEKVEGENTPDGLRLHCKINDARASFFDLDKPVTPELVAYCRKKEARSGHERAMSISGVSDKEDNVLAGLEEDGQKGTKDKTVSGINILTDVRNAIGLPYAEGLQPFRKGWYLRDSFPQHNYDFTESQTGVIACCEHTSVPATMTIRLESELPPGVYKVFLSRIYFRSRMFDTILQIQLGDDSVETAYFFGGTGNWLCAPALQTTVPASDLNIRIVQIGIGGRAEAPPYFRRMFATEQIFISSNISVQDPDKVVGTAGGSK